ncbi:hypothetical protein F4604DRAFT_1957684 [Suillus subluteus]|nr:hypothetical protein F4604DRAFT_1957684 [Suillus subluteus]
MFTPQFFTNQEFRFDDQNEQPLGSYPAPEQLSVDHNEYQSPAHQYPNAELHPPDLQSNPEPEPPSPLVHEPQSQLNDLLQGPQCGDEFVHRDITFTSYGVPRYMQWDLGAAEAPQAENAEQQPVPGVVNEHQALLLAPASTPAPNNVEAESSESLDSDSEDDQTIPVELTRAEVLSIKEKAKNELRRIMLQKEGVAPTREKRAKTVKKALKVGRIAVVGHVKYTPFETQKVKEEMVSWMSSIRRLFKEYAIYNIQKDLSLRLPIEQQGAEVPHKKRLVPTLLQSLDFLHKFAYDDSGTLVCYPLEAEWFVNMIVDVIFLNGLHPYVNAENFDSVFGLAGAAAYNALSCFKKDLNPRLVSKQQPNNRGLAKYGKDFWDADINTVPHRAAPPARPSSSLHWRSLLGSLRFSTRPADAPQPIPLQPRHWNSSLFPVGSSVRTIDVAAGRKKNRIAIAPPTAAELAAAEAAAAMQHLNGNEAGSSMQPGQPQAVLGTQVSQGRPTETQGAGVVVVLHRISHEIILKFSVAR